MVSVRLHGDCGDGGGSDEPFRGGRHRLDGQPKKPSLQRAVLIQAAATVLTIALFSPALLLLGLWNGDSIGTAAAAAPSLTASMLSILSSGGTAVFPPGYSLRQRVAAKRLLGFSYAGVGVLIGSVTYMAASSESLRLVLVWSATGIALHECSYVWATARARK